jgi:putative cell wall-binding protein
MSTLADSGSSVTVFDKNAAWVTSGDVIFHQPYHIGATITDSEGANRLSLYGHRIVWDHNDGSDWDIMMATGTSRLSSRTFGDNRYATAAAVSQAYFEAGQFVWPTQDNVVLCTGENFPDALAAAPLARALGAPLLLTRRDSIPAETMAEITRLAPTKIYIIGGEPAISAAVETQLKATYVTERIAGADRYETSAKVAAKLRNVLGADNMFRAFFARGDLFPDALALGPVAAGAQGAILLVRPTSVPSSVMTAVEGLGIKRGYVAGDSTAVSNAVLAQLSTAIIDNGGSGIGERWAGQNRYDTAVAVVVAGLAYDWIDLDVLGVATGMNFPDALGGGSAMGYYGSPVILTGKDSFNTNVANFLSWHEYDIGRIDIFGGPDVVSDAVRNAIVAKVK